MKVEENANHTFHSQWRLKLACCHSLFFLNPCQKYSCPPPAPPGPLSVVQGLRGAHHVAVQMLLGVRGGGPDPQTPLLHLAVGAALAVQGVGVMGGGQRGEQGVGRDGAGQQLVVRAQEVPLGRGRAGQAHQVRVVVVEVVVVVVVVGASNAATTGGLESTQLPDLWLGAGWVKGHRSGMSLVYWGYFPS